MSNDYTALLVAIKDLSAQVSALKTDITARLSAMDQRIDGLAIDIAALGGSNAHPSPCWVPPTMPTVALRDSNARPSSCRGVPSAAILCQQSATFPASSDVSALDSHMSTFPGPQMTIRGRHPPQGLTLRPPKPAPPPQARGLWAGVAAKTAMTGNSSLLPFALEAIAARQLRTWGMTQTYCNNTACGKPKGSPNCFRARHFDWCAPHSQEVNVGGQECGFNNNCRVVHWEEVANWHELVMFSREAGLGRYGLPNLDTVLFPGH